MKKIFTLFIASAVSIVLVSQHVNKGIKKYNVFKEQHHRGTNYSEFSQLTENLQFASKPANKLKAANATKHKLDSIVHMEFDPTLNIWSKESIQEFTYDANGNNTVIVNYDTWDAANNNWKYAVKMQYGYDEKNNPTSLENFYWDANTKQNINRAKGEITYDSNGNMTSASFSGWNIAKKQYVPNEKIEITYNSKGNIILSLESAWDTIQANWRNNLKNVHSFDANGYDTLTMVYRWNGANYVIEGKTVIAHDKKGNQTSNISSYIDTATNQFVNSYKEEYTYDNNNNQISVIYAYWDIATKSWSNQHKQETTIDADNNLSLLVYYEWNATMQQWVIGDKEVLNFNNSFARSDLILPMGYNGRSQDGFSDNRKEIIFRHEPVTDEDYSYRNGSWQLDSKFLMYFSTNDASSIATKTSNNSIAIFPNPASGFVKFNWDGNYTHLKLAIYNISGQEVLQEHVANQSSVSVNTLSTGLYIYKLMEGSKMVYSGKLGIK